MMATQGAAGAMHGRTAREAGDRPRSSDARAAGSGTLNRRRDADVKKARHRAGP